MTIGVSRTVESTCLYQCVGYRNISSFRVLGIRLGRPVYYHYLYSDASYSHDTIASKFRDTSLLAAIVPSYLCIMISVISFR